MIVLETLTKADPEWIIAETDEEGAEFYRNIGFIITSLGISPSGAEWFSCTYQVEDPEDE